MRNYTEQVRKEVDSDFCFYCGKYIKSDKTLDHIIPVSKGGKDEVSNLVVCCHDCNTIKDNYTIPQLIIELESRCDGVAIMKLKSKVGILPQNI